MCALINFFNILFLKFNLNVYVGGLVLSYWHLFLCRSEALHQLICLTVIVLCFGTLNVLISGLLFPISISLLLVLQFMLLKAWELVIKFLRFSFIFGERGETLFLKLC